VSDDTFLRISWRGRAAWGWYWLRRMVVAPAATADRCCMGSVVHPRLWCPRRAVGDSLWCAGCTRYIERQAMRRAHAASSVVEGVEE